MRFQDSLSMVWPRHIAEPSAPNLAMKFHPPPTFASPVSAAACSFVIPAVSDIFSKCDSSACTLALSLSVTPRAYAVPVLTSWA